MRAFDHHIGAGTGGLVVRIPDITPCNLIRGNASVAVAAVDCLAMWTSRAGRGSKTSAGGLPIFPCPAVLMLQES